MIKIAEKFAKLTGAQAILTGDALAQVSSQTIENISALDGVTELPIFRPLIGMNKQEIISIARKIETFELSIIPHDDACALFAPKSPVIRANKGYFYSYLEKQDFNHLLEEAVLTAELISFGKLSQIE